MASPCPPNIREVREPQTDWWTAAPVPRTYYLVTTNKGMVAELVHDETTGEWGVARRLD